MTKPLFARWLAGAAVAAMTLTTLGAPQMAAAQSYDQDYGPPPQPQPYYDPCRQDQGNREVAGGLLGGVAGAVIGSNVARGGGRTGGAIIGGVAGAALGAGVGKSTSGCQSASDQPPPPPPPPAYDRGYGYDQGGYAPPPPPPPPPPVCGTAEVRIYYPDGTMERHPHRACQDEYGHYHMAHD